MSVTIRPYQPEDHTRVCDIFAIGMRGITPTMIWDALQAPEILAAVLTVPCVAGCALFSGSIRGRVPSWLPFAGTLLSAAALPAAITLYVRRAMDSYINQSLGSDLADIEANYESQGSAFWVADVPGSSVVGMVALVHHGRTEAELKRLSVHPDARGKGVAAQLCKHLIAQAKAYGYKRVFLITTHAQQPALKLYWKLGWKTSKVWWAQRMRFYRLELEL